MKPHPRIRKTIKWGGAVVTVLLVGVWAIGGLWLISWPVTPRTYMVAANGHVIIEWDAMMNEIIERMNRVIPHKPDSRFQFNWWFGSEVGRDLGIVRWNPKSSIVVFLVWPIILVTAASTAGAWWLDARARRRARPHLCAKCGYDRTGILKDAKCPECGGGGATPASV